MFVHVLARKVLGMRRRITIILAATSVTVATVAAAFASNAAFSINEDSSVAAPVPGIGTVPELDTSAFGNDGIEGVLVKDRPNDHAYAAGEAGWVVLRNGVDVLTLVEVVPSSGWRTDRTTTERRLGIPLVEVVLTKGTRQVEFTALLVEGEIIARVELEDKHDESNESGEGTGDHDDDSTPAHGSGRGTSGGSEDDPTPTTDDDLQGATETTDDEHDEHDEHDEPPEPPEPPEVN